MTATHEKQVERQYGDRADAYVNSATHSQGPDLDRIEAMVRAHPQARVLDLGCGGGHVAYRTAPHVAEVVACDLLPAMLAAVEKEAARRGLANIRTQAAPAEALPFADASFDLVLCRLTAHHWRDWEAGLREARRVIRPGGMAIFTDTVAPADALVDTHLQAVELLRDTSHVRNRRTDEWIAGLARAGFTVDRVAMHKLPLDFAAWIERMRTPTAHVEAIRSLQANWSEPVRAALDYRDDGGFSLDVVTIEAVAV
jgi:ubiquinone/menaquinone biosynthesis C-methylase UbiE